MESFPSLLERTVASALLLLSTPPLSLSPPTGESKLSVDSEKSSLAALSASRSCSSTVTNDDGSSAEARARPLRMIADVARCHDMNLKVLSNQIVLYHCSESQLADIFTKALSVSRFQQLKSKLMVSEPPICLRGSVKDSEDVVAPDSSSPTQVDTSTSTWLLRS